MESLSEEKECQNGLTLSDRSGMKRVHGGAEKNRVGSKKIRVSEEFDGISECSRLIEPRVFEGLEKIFGALGEDSSLQDFDGKFGAFEELQRKTDRHLGDIGEVSVDFVGQEKEGIENGLAGIEEFDGGVVEGGKKVSPGNEIMGEIDFMKKGKELDFDLNEPALEMVDDGCGIYSREFMPKDDERRIEIINILSESDEEEKDAKGKNNEISEVDDFYGGLGLNIKMVDGALDFGGSNSISGERRYTREEKGKAKVSDSWLSLTASAIELAGHPEKQELVELFPVGPSSNMIVTEKSSDVIVTGRFEVEQAAALASMTSNALKERSDRIRNREILSQSARRLARFNSYQEDSSEDEQMPSLQVDELSANSPGLFSTALQMIKERNKKMNAQHLIEWKPSENPKHRPKVPSLLDLSLKVLAENADAIVSLEIVPDTLRRRLTDLLCNTRRMNVHVLDLLAKGSPNEIRIKDCSSITEDQFSKSFGNFNATNLTVLQLDLAGQCLLDYVFCKALAQSSNSLPNLKIISLRGACRLTDGALKALVASAPSLLSINLGQCSLITYVGIDNLSCSLGPILRELYLDDCQRMNGIHVLPPLQKFEYLEVLSVAGIQTISDRSVSDIVSTCGKTIKELDLAGCSKLTDYALKAIGDSCTDLRSLNISNIPKFTDVGVKFLANGCRSLQTLKLCRNEFSDEAVAAFMECSGRALKDLSLNNVTKVGPCTALSLARCSRNLLNLDLSWCRQVTNEALGLIVDSCLSLKLVKLFGCTQITNVFLDGHSNPVVQIVGLNLTPILENVNKLEPEEVLLRYSPLPSASDYHSTDLQGF